jgi:hypothetical protein
MRDEMSTMVSGEEQVAATNTKSDAHNEVVDGENSKKWYVVEDYDLGYGKVNMRIYPYANKTMALAAIPLHYSQFVDIRMGG